MKLPSSLENKNHLMLKIESVLNNFIMLAK